MYGFTINTYIMLIVLIHKISPFSTRPPILGIIPLASSNGSSRNTRRPLYPTLRKIMSQIFSSSVPLLMTWSGFLGSGLWMPNVSLRRPQSDFSTFIGYLKNVWIHCFLPSLQELDSLADFHSNSASRFRGLGKSEQSSYRRLFYVVVPNTAIITLCPLGTEKFGLRRIR